MNWEAALFPEIKKEPWASRLKLRTLREIGVKTSAQAEKQGYRLIRPAAYPSPGLWVAPADWPCLEEVAEEIRQQREAVLELRRQREEVSFLLKQAKEAKENELLANPVTQQYSVQLLPECAAPPWNNRVTWLTLRETGCKTNALASQKGFVPFRFNQGGSSEIRWIAPAEIPDLAVLAEDISRHRAERQRQKEAREAARLAEQRHWEAWHKAALPTGFSLKGRTLKYQVCFQVEASKDRHLDWKDEFFVDVTRQDNPSQPEALLNGLTQQAEARQTEVQTMAARLLASAPDFPPEIRGDLLRKAFEQSAHKTKKRVHEVEKQFREAVAQEQQRRKEIRQQEAVRAVAETLGDYPLVFRQARQMRRKLVCFTGPTNSGKTYRAMEILGAAASGVYLAPLRLLALEVRDTLLEKRVPANLITGEERELLPAARHTASTIEMLDLAEEVEVAVIDEADMLADPQRGPAWLAALCGAPARQLIIIGSAAVEPVVQQLAQRLGEPCEVIHFDRLVPLTTSPRPTQLNSLVPGDCLVTFSRRDVFDFKAYLEENGKQVSVVYGALPPEVRREQARRFREGETDILVATDAIGMGLNLPVRRMVFSTTEKFDGNGMRSLSPHLVRQIAGRAGRFGLFPEGKVSALNQDDLEYVHACLEQKPTLLRPPFVVAPGWLHVQAVAQALPSNNLGQILTAFKTHFRFNDPLFRPATIREMTQLSHLLDRFPALSLKDRFHLSRAPVDPEDKELLSCFASWISLLAANQPVPAPSWLGGTNLELLEQLVRKYVLYQWLAFRFPAFGEAELAGTELRRVASRLNESLRRRSPRRKCGSCGQTLPVAFRFPICETCHRSRFDFRDDWDEEDDW